MQTLDETWAWEANELALIVTRGRPAWVPYQPWEADPSLPLDESMRQLALLKAVVFGK